MHLRRLALPALLLVALAPGCGDDDGPDEAAPTTEATTVTSSDPSADEVEPGIPFTEALVEQEGDAFTVSWTGDGSGDVEVFAGDDPDAVGREHPVGEGGETGELVVADLPAAPRWYFELVPEEGEPLVIADRSLHLESAPNFRDVGGYRAEDGRWVRMGLVYRSDGLDELSDPDRARLHDLGIRLVCDLRTEGERTSEPDLPIDGAASEVFDVIGPGEGADLTAVITDAIVSGDPVAQQELLGDGRGEQLLVDGGREFVSSESARAAYSRMFDRLADGAALPTVFHCTAGKDRTGWATAALLTTLGVPHDVVEADYLRSNDELAEHNQATLEQVGGLIDVALLEPLLGVRAEYLDASFAEVDDAFGGFDGYLSDGIDVDAAQRQALEDLLLAG